MHEQKKVMIASILQAAPAGAGRTSTPYGVSIGALIKAGEAANISSLYVVKAADITPAARAAALATAYARALNRIIRFSGKSILLIDRNNGNRHELKIPDTTTWDQAIRQHVEFLWSHVSRIALACHWASDGTRTYLVCQNRKGSVKIIGTTA